VEAAPQAPGTYRNIAGATALAWGLIAASERSGLPLFYASYPITPASELLHELSRHKNFGVVTIQAEDEIAAANIALGAAFSGQLAVTGTSGPGIDLKAETIGLAVIMELPMIVVDVQRAGPSTGMPTKTEQADLLLAMYGRHGESPLPIVSASTPSECFAAALEAARIAVRYRTPVILLSDTFIANSSEPWSIPDVESLPRIDPAFASPNGPDFLPYSRDEKLARPWATPGTPGLVHRIGGLERQDGTGNISYDAANHELMTRLRQAKVDGIADDIPPLEVDDPGEDAELLVLGWGSSLGTITAAVVRARASGQKVATAHFRHLSPFPANTGEVVRRYPKVLIPEMNMGQLAALIRAKYLVDAQAYCKVQGLPIFAEELEHEITRVLDE
jgi:2-oxoglutarate ferredoxin oxidoreductase subunit alpha